MNNETDTYITLVTTDEHVHEENGEKNGIDSDVKEVIDKLESLKIMPKVMLVELRKVTYNIPTITQLNNYLKKLRRGKKFI